MRPALHVATALRAAARLSARGTHTHMRVFGTRGLRTRAAEGGVVDSRHITLVGAPFAHGQTLHGVDNGPNVLREGGIVEALTSLGAHVVDSGDVVAAVPKHDSAEVADGENANKVEQVGVMNNAIRAATRSVVEEGRFCLTMGGDHSVALGSVTGVVEGLRSVRQDESAELALVWVDAHADLNDPTISPSGNIHGMPVSGLVGSYQWDSLRGCEWVRPVIKPEHIVFIGLRDVDAGERVALRKLGIRAYSMHEVDKYGIAGVMERALDHVGAHVRPVHLSFDIDALDPVHAPSTGTPVPGGLTFREGRYICEVLSKTGQMISMDLVEVNPMLNHAHAATTVQSGIAMMRAAVGATLLGEDLKTIRITPYET